MKRRYEGLIFRCLVFILLSILVTWASVGPSHDNVFAPNEIELRMNAGETRQEKQVEQPFGPPNRGNEGAVNTPEQVLENNNVDNAASQRLHAENTAEVRSDVIEKNDVLNDQGIMSARLRVINNSAERVVAFRIDAVNNSIDASHIDAVNKSIDASHIDAVNKGIDASHIDAVNKSIDASHIDAVNKSIEDAAKLQHQLEMNHRVRWVLLVHLSGKADRYSAIRQTWFQKTSPHLGILAFGVKPNNYDEDISFFPTLRTNGSRSNAFRDTRLAFAFAESVFPNAEFFTKTDDDTYIYTHNFGRHLFTARLAPYSGYALENPACNPFAAGGPGYTLSRSSVSLLANCTRGRFSPFEDLGVGICLKLHGINMTSWQGLHIWHPWRMLQWELFGRSAMQQNKQSLEGYMTPLSYHYLSPEDMHLFHDDINNLGTPRRRSQKLPRIIHRFIANDSSCLQSNPGWKQTTWQLDKINLRKGKGNLARSQLFDSYNSSYAAMFEILLTYGGVFVDDHVRCVGSLDQLADELFDDDTFNLMDGFLNVNGVLALRPVSPSAIALTYQWVKANWTVQPSLEYAASVFEKAAAPVLFLKETSKYFNFTN